MWYNRIIHLIIKIYQGDAYGKLLIISKRPKTTYFF